MSITTTIPKKINNKKLLFIKILAIPTMNADKAIEVNTKINIIFLKYFDVSWPSLNFESVMVYLLIVVGKCLFPLKKNQVYNFCCIINNYTTLYTIIQVFDRVFKEFHRHKKTNYF